jgi:hypothetical protein
VSILQIVLTIIQSASIIVASFLAILGVNSWRRETVGKKKLDLAEKTLALFYEARDNIKFIRNPAGFIGEGSTRKKDDKESEEETKILNQAYVIIERNNKVSARFSELFSLKYHFMAVFGKDNSEYFEDLNKTLNKIFIANNMLYGYYLNPRTLRPVSQENEARFLKGFEEHERIIWDIGDNDEINKKINEIITGVEKVCESASRKI